MFSAWRPMPLLRAPEPFDHPDWLFELKHDGFRALAIIEGHRCRFLSRNGHEFRQWPQLAEEVAHAAQVRRSAVLDGEIVCLKPGGQSDFYSLLFRREWPYFYAFDLLSLEGKDLRRCPLSARKRALARIMLRIAETRLRYVDHLAGRGRDLFRLACDHDAEGIVAKWVRGPYHTDGSVTSWLKVKNPDYSQAPGRHEFFDGPRRPYLGRVGLDPALGSSLRLRSVRLAGAISCGDEKNTRSSALESVYSRRNEGREDRSRRLPERLEDTSQRNGRPHRFFPAL